jgi:hypothetical protein
MIFISVPMKIMNNGEGLRSSTILKIGVILAKTFFVFLSCIGQS